MSLTTIIITFVIAAAFGATLYFFVLKDKPRPWIVVLLHGGFALAALSALTFYTGTDYADMTEKPDTANLIFWIGATGGAYMFIRDKVLKKGIPKWMPLIHAGIGVTALVMLIFYAFGK